MLDSIWNNRRVIRIRCFWEGVFYALSELVQSRSVWVAVGTASTLLCALAGVVYYWSRSFSFAGYVVVQLACLVCQVVALIPVAWPGRAATPRIVAGFSDLHYRLTILTVSGAWALGVVPGACLLMLFGVDVESPPMAAVVVSGMALMMACIAGGITGVFVSGKVTTRLGEAAGPPVVRDWGDSGDSADVDWGSFDADVDSGGFDGD